LGFVHVLNSPYVFADNVVYDNYINKLFGVSILLLDIKQLLKQHKSPSTAARTMA